MRRWVILRRVLAGVVVLLVLAGVGGYWYARPLLLTGTGYAAHSACALQSLAGRTDAQSDLPPNALVPYLRTSTDEQGASTTILGVLARQRAWSTPDDGCVLTADRPAQNAAAAPVTAGANPFSNATAPTTDPATEALVAEAFGDDLPAAKQSALGTRAVLVVRDGQLVAERYAAGFTKDTRQLGWSMSKSVANLVVGRLVLDQDLRLDRAGLRPEWTDERRAITLDQLMRMTSGLTWDETYDLGTEITAMLYLEADMPAFVAAQPSAHAPGTYQQYSSGSTNLLCWAAADLTGIDPRSMLREQLFRPLGLTSAVMETDARGDPVCSSYVWATPRDWAAIGQFALQGGTLGGQALLPAGWMERSTTDVPVQKSEEEGYAAGWWVNQRSTGDLVDPRLPADAYWASGHDGQRVFVVPSKGLVVVRLGFSPTITGDDLRIAGVVGKLAAAQ